MGGAIFDETGAEYIVGTYIDSNGNKKYIYEKVLNVGNVPVGSTTLNHNITNFGKVLNVSGFGVFDGLQFPLIYPSTNNKYLISIGNFSGINYLINVAPGFTGGLKSVIVTLQYTKTTDVSE